MAYYIFLNVYAKQHTWFIKRCLSYSERKGGTWNLEFVDLYLKIPAPLRMAPLTNKSLNFIFLICKNQHDNNNNSNFKGLL